MPHVEQTHASVARANTYACLTNCPGQAPLLGRISLAVSLLGRISVSDAKPAEALGYQILSQYLMQSLRRRWGVACARAYTLHPLRPLLNMPWDTQAQAHANTRVRACLCNARGRVAQVVLALWKTATPATLLANTKKQGFSMVRH
jgi:hypothetical protein